MSVDPPGANAAMVEKLHLPFPLLSDPDGSGAIKPYGVWNDDASIATPAIVLVDTRGEEAYRQISRDFADRATEDQLLEAARKLGLEPVTQDPPAPGDPQPSDRAMPVRALAPYYRGAKFAVKAMSMRFPETQAEAKSYSEQLERYAEAAKSVQH